ncbi:MAG: MATE family efflux transporter [Planctomycetota bacterium]|jgi:putative MATE family efflux protein
MSSPQERAAGKRDLVSGSLFANLMRLALPLAAGWLLHSLYVLADRFWLGKLSTQALAAPTVTMPFFFFVISFGMGFGSAGTALVAQFTGAKRYREADRAAAQVLVLLAFLAAVLTIPMVLFAPRLLALYQVPEDMRHEAVTYFRIMMSAMPFIAFSIAYGSVLRALGDTITVVVIGVVSNGLNLLLDPVLIFGWGGLPAMGVAGAAVATVLARLVHTAACLWLLRKGHAGLHLQIVDFRPDRPILKKTLSVGLPAAVGNSSNSLGFMGLQFLFNRLGTAVVAAFGIGHPIIHFFQVPSHSLAMAAAPIVGQALGAQKPSLARRVVKVSAAIVGLGMILPVAFVMWKGQFVAGLFTKDPAVVTETGRLFLMVPASSYCFGVIMVLMAAFYGSGHTRPAMVLSLVRLWVLRLPIGWILGFVVGLGSVGVYGGMVAGNMVSAALALWLFLRGDWQRAVIAEDEQHG